MILVNSIFRHVITIAVTVAVVLPTTHACIHLHRLSAKFALKAIKIAEILRS